jgi:hypothetical protein
LPVPDQTRPDIEMAKRIFDQAELKSAKAQRFADAFIGCDEWIDSPRDARRSEPGPDPTEETIDYGLFDQHFESDAGRSDRRAA